MNAAPVLSFRRILVLCEGNYCRSPMAEVLLKASLGPGADVSSAGLGALHGQGAAPEVLALMAGRGLDLSAHRCRQVTPAHVREADLVLVMDRRQKARCESVVPSARGKVFLLAHWLPPGRQEIADPFRRGEQAFHEALDHIDQSVTAWLPRLLQAPRPA